MKTQIKIKTSNSNLIRSLIKLYIKYCQKLDFETLLQYPNENLNNKTKKNLISNLIKSLFKIYITYCQKLDISTFSPNINENLNDKNKKLDFTFA